MAVENATSRMSRSTASVPEGIVRTCFPSWQWLLAALLVCVIVPSSLIGLHIHENPRLSPIDEAAHFDYVSRVAHGSIPRLGQFLLPSTLHLISCTGTALAFTPPHCPGSPEPRRYAGGGYQYEAQQPPTYYVATVPIRWVGNHLFGMSPLTAARAGGALWMSLGLLLLWMAGRIVGLGVIRLVPAMLLLACGPVAIYESAIVSNDAPSIFAGALIAFLGALAWARPGRWTLPVLAAGAFLVTSLKLDDALAVVVVSGTFAIIWWSDDDSAGTGLTPRLGAWMRRWAPNGGALLLGALVCVVLWVVVNRELDLIDPRKLPAFDVLRTQPVGVSEVARESLLMLNPLAGAFSAFRTNASGIVVGTTLSLNLQQITATFLQYALLAGGAAALFVRRRIWAHWVGLTSIIALYVGGIVLGIGLLRTYSSDPSLSGRYGLAVAPFLALALVATVRGRWVVMAVVGASVALVGLTYYYTLAA
jgi:hypothetical protein